MLDWLLERDFMPHGHCYLWRPDILWMHVISDSLIALAYFSIPITLIYFVRRRRDLPFPWVLWLFAAFILLCGTTHIFSIITIWKPLYALDGIIKVATAAVSVLTAAVMIPLVPMVLTLRSPAELEASNVKLRREAELRQIAEAEMVRARDEALKASATKSQFLANMSHEIRTPMNGVVGMTGALLSTSLTPQQQEFAETIRFSAEALLAVINDILDISKIEAGAMRVEFENFDLQDVVEKAVAIVALRAQSKGIELIADIDPKVPAAMKGDPQRLLQVLTNLLSNAVKFTDSGEVELRITLEWDKASEIGLRFTVRDTGIGISDDVRARLFRPFAQADGTSTRKYGGTGLGLAISRSLVELMGGSIGVESESGRGSTFSFSLPLVKCPNAERTVSGNLQNLRALVVDDSHTHRRAFASWLSAWGMRVDEAPDGATALQQIHEMIRQDDPYGVVLIDRGMPEMDGIELARALARAPLRAQMRIVLLETTSSPDADTAPQYLGIEAVLVKPVRQSMLYNLILSLLEKRAAVSSPIAKSDKVAEQEANSGFGQQWRILLAEDNPVNQRVAVHQLTRLGMKVDVVSDGREAVEAVRRQAYDIILMDCQMPELDGYGATAQIRALEGSARRTQIIAMTAHAMAGDRENCIDAGMDDYLAKPASYQALREVLMRCLSRLTAPAAGIG